MEKKCNFCGNANTHATKADYFYNMAGKIVLFRNVPCEVCEYCGEKYFEARDLKKIEGEVDLLLVKKSKTPEHSLQVPVEEFSAITL